MKHYYFENIRMHTNHTCNLTNSYLDSGIVAYDTTSKSKHFIHDHVI